MTKDQRINNTVKGVLVRIVKKIQRSYPVPEKIFIWEEEWHQLVKELEQYCKYNDVPGPLSKDCGYTNVLVKGIPVGIQEMVESVYDPTR